MRILSATEAITPAIERAKLLLFKPFRMGRSWKLAATAYLSFAGSMFFPFPLLYLFAIPVFDRLGAPGAIFVMVIAPLFTLVYCVVFWLCSRLQFAFFDIALNHGEFVAPAWRKYGAVSRPWTLIKIIIGCVVFILFAVAAVPLLRIGATSFFTMLATMKTMQPNQPPPPQLFNFMAGFYGIYFLAMFALGLYAFIMGTVSGFMVPSMALESFSPKTAFQGLINFVKGETGAFFGYVGLRFGLGVVGYIAITIGYEIVLIVLMLIYAAICALIGFLLHAIGVPTPVLFGLGILAYIFFIFGINGYLLFLLIGAFFTFFEAHTLYFLGGRYPKLGDLLEASTPPPSLQPPPPAYPSYAPPQPPLAG